MYSGFMNDVNNSISAFDVYAAPMDMPMNVGTPQGNVQTAPNNEIVPSTSNNTATQMPVGNGKGVGSAHWWLVFVAIFAGFIFVARKFGGGDSYSNIRMSVYNGLFLTFFIILMLNFMKVLATKLPPNPVSALIMAA